MLTTYKEKLNNEGAITLQIKAIPKSSKCEIKEIMANGTIKIKVTNPPENGKANIQIIEILSKEFNTAKQNIQIISGHSTGQKLIKITKPQ